MAAETHEQHLLVFDQKLIDTAVGGLMTTAFVGIARGWEDKIVNLLVASIGTVKTIDTLRMLVRREFVMSGANALLAAGTVCFVSGSPDAADVGNYLFAVGLGIFSMKSVIAACKAQTSGTRIEHSVNATSTATTTSVVITGFISNFHRAASSIGGASSVAVSSGISFFRAVRSGVAAFRSAPTREKSAKIAANESYQPVEHRGSSVQAPSSSATCCP